MWLNSVYISTSKVLAGLNTGTAATCDILATIAMCIFLGQQKTMFRQWADPWSRSISVTDNTICDQHEEDCYVSVILHDKPWRPCCPGSDRISCRLRRRSQQNLLVRRLLFVYARKAKHVHCRMPFHLSISKLHVNTLRKHSNMKVLSAAFWS